jgi:hypothetical protein
MEADKIISTEVAQKNLDPISYFDKDADFVFVFKKTEKLASAIYMITSLFSESEPMKWNLRKKATEIVSFTVTYKDVGESVLNDFIYNYKTKVLELVSLLEISERGGLISHMNFSILQQEFSNVLDALKSQTSKDSGRELLPKTFFEAQSRADYHRMSHSSIKDKNFIPIQDGFKRSNRQNIIMGLLKKKKELTIKDIAQVIKDCSEKTIQRELNSFIIAGVIKRTGERRWSKYSLVQPETNS